MSYCEDCVRFRFRPAGMPPGIDYFEYMYPGFIVLVLLFTAIFANASQVMVIRREKT